MSPDLLNFNLRSTGHELSTGGGGGAGGGGGGAEVPKE